MAYPTLYRRRFIPDEIVCLKDDRIIYQGSDLIITEWKTLKPRADFSHGISWYLLDKGFKVSKFFKASGELHYIYCDIIEHEYSVTDNAYIFNDLLVDVIIHNDGQVRVLDIGEITDALDGELISLRQAKDALAKLDALLQVIYSGKIMDLIEGFDNEKITRESAY